MDYLSELKLSIVEKSYEELMLIENSIKRLKLERFLYSKIPKRCENRLYGYISFILYKNYNLFCKDYKEVDRKPLQDICKLLDAMDLQDNYYGCVYLAMVLIRKSKALMSYNKLIEKLLVFDVILDELFPEYGEKIISDKMFAIKSYEESVSEMFGKAL